MAAERYGVPRGNLTIILPMGHSAPMDSTERRHVGLRIKMLGNLLHDVHSFPLSEYKW